MKKKLRLKQWVKDAIAIILIALLMLGGLLLIDARFKQLCNNGYTRYCPIVEGSKK